MHYLGEGAVVPDVAVVREAVVDVAQFALLDVLLDGVQLLLRIDLHVSHDPRQPISFPPQHSKPISVSSK